MLYSYLLHLYHRVTCTVPNLYWITFKSIAVSVTQGLDVWSNELFLYIYGERTYMS